MNRYKVATQCVILALTSGLTGCTFTKNLILGETCDGRLHEYEMTVSPGDSCLYETDVTPLYYCTIVQPKIMVELDSGAENRVAGVSLERSNSSVDASDSLPRTPNPPAGGVYTTLHHAIACSIQGCGNGDYAATLTLDNGCDADIESVTLELNAQ